MSIKERTFSSNKTEKRFALTFVVVVVVVVVVVIFKCNYDHISDLTKYQRSLVKKFFFVNWVILRGPPKILNTIKWLL